MGSTLLAIEQIRIDGGTQIRAVVSPETVAAYAEAMQEGAKFPPITVFYDGEAHWLADGFQRLAAAKKLDWREIDADVRSGTRRDAILHACGANEEHGDRRANADKRRPRFGALLALGGILWQENANAVEPANICFLLRACGRLRTSGWSPS